jgi:hypothetical protein
MREGFSLLMKGLGSLGKSAAKGNNKNSAIEKL